MDSRYVDDLIDDDEIPELTAEDFANMIPFSQLPLEMQEKLLSIKTATFVPDEEKVPVPVSKSVLEGFRARGDDWQGRVDQVLREWLDQHKAS